MSILKNNRFMTLLIVCGIGVYTGVRFFEPIVVEGLEKHGTLRKDIDIPKFDSKGRRIYPTSENEGAEVSKESNWENFAKRLEAKPEDKDKYPLNSFSSNNEKK
ncbi:hypothetical protein HII13_004036 [Brettanomyces bruxellensis]|uniref:DEBR0S1_18976g1_1 n=1 Tax=Dekkera bruxellensis TaxID=5007 RepID=A0A7D9H236_DEKBR|nr:hypothetical protein HII13_004036 [Brettanomyces bruxellensis]KAF6008373.1 hypothetical protein HII12_004121 [Brettanomyces bruxellensis]VUG16525.1 DEBR0S1_18976g1_1 [Brettanomyces bruxellensis]